jgi:isopenicillin-N epimerase
MNELRQLFMLDPEVVFLNHGSFGATPLPVFQAYQEWQRRLERQPVRFLTLELIEHMRQARETLAKEFHTDSDQLTFIPNATYGVNLIARCLNLEPGDEILASDHEYGACDKIWRFISEKRQAVYRQQDVRVPFTTVEEVVEQFWQGVTPRTRLIFLSHITSPTAMIFPVAELCLRARLAGILTFVDGAHAPGQIDLDINAIDPDFYVGNCHKWLCAPKGSGFLFARKDLQHLIEPLVISWGWKDDSPFECGSPFLNATHWSGTDDPAAYLSVPAAIQFQNEHAWPDVRQVCHSLLKQTLHRTADLPGCTSLYPTGEGQSRFYSQMASISLPPIQDSQQFKSHLYEKYRLEIPVIQWKDGHLLRVSIQGYNEQEEIDILIHALEDLLPQFSPI